MSYNNDLPLQFVDSQNAGHLFNIVVNSNETATAVHQSGATPSLANFLGAIVSADRSVIYWINESKPLP